MTTREKEILNGLTDNLEELADLVIEIVDMYDIERAKETAKEVQKCCDKLRGLRDGENGHDPGRRL